MLESLLIENVVSTWILAVVKDLLIKHRESQWPDFELRSPEGQHLLLEIKTKRPTEATLNHLALRFRNYDDTNARFLLVTPEVPDQKALNIFRKAFQETSNRADWRALDELPTILGKPSPGPWNSPQTWSSLQTKSLIDGLKRYKNAPIGITPYETGPPLSDIQPLARQFSYETISRLMAIPGTMENRLGLGSRRDNVTVVLSDIVNFSSLVTASRPDDLKEAMGNYYRRARLIVFEHGGMLDKFIGDAVLAVFGYPEGQATPAVNALKYAKKLIDLGKEVLGDWQAELNAVIPTGTRVGIANGDIWPINIGEGCVEVSLLGDTINLAARLEKNAAVDRFLLDNRTHTFANRENSAYVMALGLQQLVIPAADAKGQAFPVRAWTQL